MRGIRWHIPAALAALTLALAVPAVADPAGYIDTNNGRVAVTVAHPDEDACSASVAVDLHRLTSGALDLTASYISGHVRITRTGTTRAAQVENIRVGDPSDNNPVVNDLYPSASSSARDNTGARDPATAGLTTSGNLYRNDNDAVSSDDPPWEPPFVADPLNSRELGNTVTLRAYSDWLPVTLGNGYQDARVAVFGSLRCGSGALHRFTVRSTTVGTV